jgi:hypothetical protein
MRPRLQSFDATFTTQATDAITVHNAGVAVTVPSRPGVSTFRRQQELLGFGRPGRRRGERSATRPNGTASRCRTLGTSMRVTSVTPGGFMQVQVTPPAK